MQVPRVPVAPAFMPHADTSPAPERGSTSQEATSRPDSVPAAGQERKGDRQGPRVTEGVRDRDESATEKQSERLRQPQRPGEEQGLRVADR